VETVVVTDTPRRHVSIRLALDDLVMTESRYAAGERGPDPHVHRLHVDCFYVLGGTFTLFLADGDHRLGPGSFALVPPNVVHAFRNDGPGDLHFLNLHAPGMGFDRYVREIGGTGEEFRVELAARYDQHPPPDDGGLDPETAILSGSGAGERIDDTLIKAARPELSVLEIELEPGAGVAGHLHRGHHDTFVVLDGELRFDLGEDDVEAASGTCIAASPGIVHGVRNTGGRPARLLNVHAPGGFAEYRRELAVLRDAGIEPDAAFFARHDVFDPA